MRRSTPLILAVALIPFALVVARFAFVCDDAYIAFRYGRNLAEGLGLRFNPGVEPPVEGYTQFGWVLWIALFEWLGWDPTVGSRVTTIACGALLLGLTVRFARERMALGTGGTLAAALVFAGSPCVGVWSTGGLETMAFALLVFVAFERLLGDPDRPRGVQAGLAGAGVVLLRSDGPFWLATLGAIALVRAVRARGGRRRATARALATCTTLVAAVFLAHLAWRWSYYGDWVPNTARAKVGLSGMTLQRGLFYVVSFWLTLPATLLAPLAALPLALVRRDGTLGALLALAGATFAYPVLVGGDFMAMGRFLVPAMAPVALACGALVDALARRASPPRPVLAAAVGVLLVASSVPPVFDRHVVPLAVRERFHFRWNSPLYISECEKWRRMTRLVERFTVLGKALAVHTRPGETLVQGGIGAVGYHSRMFLYDRHGYVNREVVTHPVEERQRRSPGHDRVVSRWFFGQWNPTYVGAFVNLPADDGAADEDEDGQPQGGQVIELDPADGFPDGAELVLVRFNRRAWERAVAERDAQAVDG